MVVVPVGALTLVVVGATVVVGVALVVVVVVLGVVGAGGEVNVGPADAGNPTLPALLRWGFGAGGTAGCRLTGLDLGAGVDAATGCGAGLT